eukprot:SAG31_NODE_10950_length_1077_cov_3.766327_1_plen_233_part_01
MSLLAAALTAVALGASLKDHCYVSPNCAARNRQECTAPHTTCGPCLQPFVSDQGDYANTPCVSVSLDGAADGMGTVPVIDMAKLKQGTDVEKREVVAVMKAALTGPGFMYLANSGVDPTSLLSDMRAFFARSDEEKAAYAWADPAENSGYVRIGGEGLDEDAESGDPKESYDMNKKHMLASEVWANSSAVEYWRAANQLKEDVLRGYALALGIEPDFFQEPHAEEWNTLRLLH